jgi:hypothetical protein
MQERQAAPWPPFIQITNQHSRHIQLPLNMLGNYAHLRPSQRLYQRKMRPDDPQWDPRARRFNHDCTTMNATGQIEQRDRLNFEFGMQEDNDANEAAAGVCPFVVSARMNAAQTTYSLNFSDIKEAWIWGAIRVRFGQDQGVKIRLPNLIAQDRKRAIRIDDTVIATAAMHVPSNARKKLWRGCHGSSS